MRNFVFQTELPFGESLLCHFEKEKENLFSVLEKSEKEDLLKSLKNANFIYSKDYWNSSVDDGQTYRFNLVHLNRKKDSILIHQEKGPKKLYNLAESIKTLIDGKKFKKK